MTVHNLPKKARDKAVENLEKALAALYQVDAMAHILEAAFSDETMAASDDACALQAYAETMQGILSPAYKALTNGIEALREGKAD